MDTVDIKKIIGINIKKFRLSQKISQEKLAELSSLNRTYISNIERGLKSPSIEVLYKISLSLKVDIKNFFDKELL